MARKILNRGLEKEITAYNVPPVKIGDKCVCPECKKQFKITEDSAYLIGNQFTCSWACLLKHVKRTQPETNRTYEKKKEFVWRTKEEIEREEVQRLESKKD